MKEAARGSRSRVSGRSTGNPRQQCRPTARQPDGQTATSRGCPTYKPREATTSSRAAATAAERSGEPSNTRRKKRSTRPHRASYGGPRYGRRYCDATETPAVLASPKNAQTGKNLFGPFRFAALTITSAAGSTGSTCKLGKAKITAIAKGKAHPYYLIAVSGGGSTVYGWVDASAVSVGSEAAAATPYRVKITADVLNIRKGPGTNHGTNGSFKGGGIYTIVAESTGTGATKWGKLKSGAGWISLDYASKV